MTNKRNYGRHIWDRRDARGSRGRARDVRRHSAVRRSTAGEYPKPEIYSFIRPRGYLTRPGMPNHIGDDADQYRGVPHPILRRC